MLGARLSASKMILIVAATAVGAGAWPDCAWDASDGSCDGFTLGAGFVLGKLGVDGCPEGSSPIDDEATCQKVQQAVGKVWQPRKPEKGAVCNWCGGCSKAGTIRLSAAHGAKAKWLCKADAVAIPEEKEADAVAIPKEKATGAGAGAGATKTPMQRVVELIAGLRQKVVTDGQVEQTDYNTYACWCEDTLGRKANDISASKDLIAESEILIKKLEGQIASHGAEIEGLAKDIAKNQASQKEAADVRAKAFEDYSSERSENEQCIGALEAAIKTLTGTGTKKSFLDTSTRKAQVLSVAAQLRTVLRHKAFSQSAEEKDLDVVKQFVTKPEAFLVAGSTAMSAAQVGQNPFGDYAPQSTQIQGILKGMYDTFTADLEKDNADEAESRKSYESLMSTKEEELKTLQKTKVAQETGQAEKTLKLREAEGFKMTTAEELAADETFFADTKEACKVKAGQWSVRVRLRTEELAGMSQAINILSGGDDTFKSATTSFVQLASNQHAAAGTAYDRMRTMFQHAKAKGKAYGRIRGLATKFRSLQLAEIAVALQMNSPFDKVISMIDDMLALLREEAADDIRHRDMCEDSIKQYGNEKGDADNALSKATKQQKRLNRTKHELSDEITKIEGEINTTNVNLAALTKLRNKDHQEFSAALKHDTEAVALVREAIVTLNKFYKNNKIPIELTQKAAMSAPKYTEDEDEAPKTSWSGSDYGGRKSETSGIVEILEMLVEDLEKEIADGRADEAEDEKDYQKQAGSLQKVLDTKDATKVGLEEERANVQDDLDVAEDEMSDQTALGNNKAKSKLNLKADCAWVESHFEKRKTDREDEMQGLVDAKSFLAGVDAGDDPLPPV